MKKILFVTDFYYEAKGRLYYEEHLFLTGQLRKDFDLVICNPKDMNKFTEDFDLTIFRNAGPIANFKEEYDLFRQNISSKKTKYIQLFQWERWYERQILFNRIDKQRIWCHKNHRHLQNFDKLPESKTYVVKPKDGADSIGIEFLSKDEVFKTVDKNDKNRRWELKEYTPTKEDLEFAQSFIEWNNLDHGIQRVDACRDENDQLLLVELEDLNPYLSLLDISPTLRDKFVTTLKSSIKKALDKN